MAIMNALLARDAHVRMVKRNGEAELPDGAALVYGDASDPAFALEASQDAEVLCQALNPPYTQWAELFPPLQQAVLSAAAATRAKLVSLENVYMYGELVRSPEN